MNRDDNVETDNEIKEVSEDQHIRTEMIMSRQITRLRRFQKIST